MIINRSPNFIKFLYFLILILVCCLVILFIYACVLKDELSAQETINLLLGIDLRKVILNNQELRNTIHDIVYVKPWAKYWAKEARNFILIIGKVLMVCFIYAYHRNFNSCISGILTERNVIVKDNTNENKIYDADDDLKLPDNVTPTEESSAYFIIKLIKKIWCYFF
jgi:hypothetical protein